MSQKLRFLGITVYMNGGNYIVPSLSYLDFKANYPLLTAPPTEDESLLDYYGKFIPVIGLAIRRNYPEVTDADLTAWLDVNTFPLAIQSLRGGSGLTAVAEGE